MKNLLFAFFSPTEKTLTSCSFSDPVSAQIIESKHSISNGFQSSMSQLNWSDRGIMIQITLVIILLLKQNTCKLFYLMKILSCLCSLPQACWDLNGEVT